MQLHTNRHISGHPLPAANPAFVPRRERSHRRAEAAKRRGQAAGLPMMLVLESMVAATSGDFWHINQRKRKVESIILRGPRASREFFADIAKQAPEDFDEAMAHVEAAYREARRQLLAMDSNLIGSHGHTMRVIQLDRLHNARVILRLMRGVKMQHAFPLLLRILRAPLWSAASASDGGEVVFFDVNNDIPDWE